MNIETCLSPALAELYDLKGKVVVVIDVLRATTCIVSGIAHGTPKMLADTSVENCICKQQEEGYLAAGERNGIKVEGFDLGNSPYEHIEAAQKNQPVIISTTNGTRAIAASEEAHLILIGAMINLKAIVEKLKELEKDVVLFCSGWKNGFSMEDTLFAGAVLDALGNEVESDCDASLAALHLYRSAKAEGLVPFMKKANHFRRLERLGIEKDLNYCFQESTLDVIPFVDEDGFIKKMI